MATLVELSSAQLNGWIGAYVWPFVRIAALTTAAPIFGTRTVPVRVRLGIALALTAVIAPLLPAPPTADPLSLNSLGVTVHQVVIGLALGFTLRLVFTALEVAGEIIGHAMGLGFASLIDPQNGVPVPVIGQLFTVLAILMFFAMNGHAVLIEVLAESFRVLPIGTTGLAATGLYGLATLGGLMFAGGLAIALPVVAALLLVNVAFGVMTRAAPQINIFAVGFPIMLGVGLLMLIVALPLLPQQWSGLLEQGFAAMRGLSRSP